MVEGFLVTIFQDEAIESVGHVWNEINGNHFDATMGLKKHDRIVKNNFYFIDTIYDKNDRKIEERTKAGVNMYDAFFEPPDQHLAFKTTDFFVRSHN